MVVNVVLNFPVRWEAGSVSYVIVGDYVVVACRLPVASVPGWREPGTEARLPGGYGTEDRNSVQR